MKPIPRRSILSLSLLALACSGSGDDGIYSETNMMTVPTVGDGDGDGGPKLDVHAEEATAEDGDGDGCQKVDFLFVIDNSGSMAEEQDALIASFPDFIQSIQNTLSDAQDYHIMIVDTDEWVYGGCQLLCAFPQLPGLCTGYECGVTQPEQCENILGAGVTHPKGSPDASNQECNFSSGKRYMDDTEPTLVGPFNCAARVGTGSTEDPERPMEAMVAAVSGGGAVGTCNDGFLRDDAILVVTFITDEDDDSGDGSAGSVQSWHDDVVAAKDNDEDAVVVLGLFGDQDLQDPVCGAFDPDGGNGAEPSDRLVQFVESWGDQGLRGSICADEYDEFFQSAVDLIDTTCDGFIPPG
jgi:hypothetical protein